MAHGTHKPLSKANADVLESRLFEHVSAEVRLPFLDDVDERRIKRCVIALIVHAMATELPLEKVIDLENAKPIVVDILTRGIVSMFFEPEERSRLVDTLSSNVKNVPFVPIGVVNLMLEQGVAFVAGHIKQALRVTTGEVLTGKTSDEFQKDPTKA